MLKSDSWKLLSAVSVLFLSSPSQAAMGLTASSLAHKFGAGKVFGTIEGQAELTAVHSDSSKTCPTIVEGKHGFTGYIGGVLCILRNELGISGVGSTTKKRANGDSVHAEIISKDTTVGSTTYKFDAKIWHCAAAKDCTVATNFTKVMHMIFNFEVDTTDASKSATNKGIIAIDTGAMDGTTEKFGFYAEYDMPTVTGSTNTIEMWGFKPDIFETTEIESFKVNATKTGVGDTTAKVSVGVTMVNQTSLFKIRLAMAHTTADYAGTVFVEQAGLNAGPTASACSGISLGCETTTNDTDAGTMTITNYNCYTGVAETNTDGYSDITFTDASSNSGCTAPVLLATDSLTNVGAYTFSAVMDKNSMWTDLGSPTL